MRNAMRLSAGLMLMATVLAGCEGAGSHEMRNAAKDRWQEARSNILYSLARQQFNNGELDKAEKTIMQAMNTDADRSELYVLAARIAMEKGKLERGFFLIEKALELDAERAETHYVLGVIYQRWQKYDLALESYSEAYRLEPDNVAGLLAAGEMMVELDRSDEAIELLGAKVSYFENNASIRQTLGRVHFLRHEFADAVRYYRDAAVLDPENRQIIEQLAAAELGARQYGEAIEHLTTLLDDLEYIDRDDLRMTLGDCYMATGRPVDARAQFMTVVRRNENDVTAWIKLGQAAWVVEDEIRVAQAAERIIALASHRHEGYVLRGLWHQRHERLDAAIGDFEQAGRLAPQSSAPWLLKGVALQRRGDIDAAVEAYRNALKISPDDSRAQRLLAATADR